jgi:hypothetical protein
VFGNAATALRAAGPYPAQVMTAVQLGPAINSSRNEGLSFSCPVRDVAIEARAVVPHPLPIDRSWVLVCRAPAPLRSAESRWEPPLWNLSCGDPKASRDLGIKALLSLRPRAVFWGGNSPSIDA